MTDSQTAADDGTKRPFWRRILGQPALYSGPVWIAASLFYYGSAFTHPAGSVRWTLLLLGLVVGSSLFAMALLDYRHKRADTATAESFVGDHLNQSRLLTLSFSEISRRAALPATTYHNHQGTGDTRWN